jgi:hypothetical protein
MEPNILNTNQLVKRPINDAGVEKKPMARISSRKSPPSLRPPTLMIDLLFGALMLFAFQMGDPNSVTVIPKDFDIPTSNEKASNKKQTFLALRPIKNEASEWVYETTEGRRLSPKGVAKIVNSENKTPILLVPSKAKVQNYIDAEQPLRRLGIKAGLAVTVK